MRITCLMVAAGVVAVVAAGCSGVGRQHLPPAEKLMHPGPGVDGPGPGVMSYDLGVPPGPQQTSQVAFVGADGMIIHWDVAMPGAFDSEPLVCPGRQDFPQGAIYRLKLTNIPGHPAEERYPTLEIAPTTPRTAAFLAHNAIPVQFTEEDFAQVASGNFVTKVIYLPDPEFQELALPGAMAGVETLVSSRLDPGVDPIVEADRRGAILAVVRMGNKDLEVPAPGGVISGPDEVIQTSYGAAIPGGAVPPGAPTGMPLGTPMGVPLGAPPTTVPTNYISGVTGPQYGMPMSGTPIGLAGPPHVPLGGPAGMRRHVMVNHTNVRVPPPSSRVRIDVKQVPGMNYPAPADHAWVVERTGGGVGCFRQPVAEAVEVIRPDQYAEGVAY